MADRKYVRIPAKDLPDVIYRPDSGNVYIARYRVASEDGRQVSRWSQSFEVPFPAAETPILQAAAILLPPEKYDVKAVSGILSATWNVDDLFKDKKIFVNKFHVYVRFHNNLASDNWNFIQETTSTNFQTVIPAGFTKVDVAILLPTYRGLDASSELADGVAPINKYPESVLFTKTNVVI
jgi:hypothetical protein